MHKRKATVDDGSNTDAKSETKAETTSLEPADLADTPKTKRPKPLRAHEQIADDPFSLRQLPLARLVAENDLFLESALIKAVCAHLELLDAVPIECQSRRFWTRVLYFSPDAVFERYPRALWTREDAEWVARHRPHLLPRLLVLPALRRWRVDLAAHTSVLHIRAVPADLLASVAWWRRFSLQLLRENRHADIARRLLFAAARVVGTPAAAAIILQEYTDERIIIAPREVECMAALAESVLTDGDNQAAWPAVLARVLRANMHAPALPRAFAPLVDSTQVRRAMLQPAACRLAYLPDPLRAGLASDLVRAIALDAGDVARTDKTFLNQVQVGLRDGGYLYAVPPKKRTRAVCLRAAHHSWRNLAYVPAEQMDAEILAAGLAHEDADVGSPQHWVGDWRAWSPALWRAAYAASPGLVLRLAKNERFTPYEQAERLAWAWSEHVIYAPDALWQDLRAFVACFGAIPESSSSSSSSTTTTTHSSPSSSSSSSSSTATTTPSSPSVIVLAALLHRGPFRWQFPVEIDNAMTPTAWLALLRALREHSRDLETDAWHGRAHERCFGLVETTERVMDARAVKDQERALVRRSIVELWSDEWPAHLWPATVRQHVAERVAHSGLLPDLAAIVSAYW